MKRIAFAAGLVLVAAALAGVLRPEGASAVDPAPSTDSVTVAGTGVVTAVPDRAQISAGVESRAATARAALQANATAMQKVIDALESRGGQGRHDADRVALDRIRRAGPAERLRRDERRLGRDDARRRRARSSTPRSRRARTRSTARRSRARTPTRSIARRSRRPSRTRRTGPRCSRRRPAESSGGSRRSSSRAASECRSRRRREAARDARPRSSRGRRRRPRP